LIEAVEFGDILFLIHDMKYFAYFDLLTYDIAVFLNNHSAAYLYVKCHIIHCIHCVYTDNSHTK